ncbi:MAG: hypothetical protein P8N74_04860, partial [Polaribacter sp.]|nr:hypothetical protein [Polaribacter sp.]
MKIPNPSMAKRAFFFIFVFTFNFLSFSQQQSTDCQINTSLSLTSFNSTSKYVQGGHMAIFFEPVGIFELDNEFILELSDQTGDFSSAIELSRKEEFFIPALNGVIPNDVPAGSNYKLRVRATNPAVEIETTSFEIISVANPDITPAQIDFINNNNYTNLDSFIKCVDLADNNYSFGYKNQGLSNLTPSDNGGIKLKYTGGNASETSVRILNSGSWQELPEVSSFSTQFLIPSGLPVNYYLIEIDRVINIGTAEEYHNISGFIFHFNTNITGISNTSPEIVCVGEEVGFEIPINSLQGNYPGSLYSIHYGDTDESDPTNIEKYSHSRLLNCNVLNHTYDSSTCSSDYKEDNSNDPDDNNPEYKFKLDFNLLSKGLYSSVDNSYRCDSYIINGGGTTKWIYASLKPSAAIETEGIICESTSIFAKDVSISGLYGTGAECERDYNSLWEVLEPGANPESGWVSVDTSDEEYSSWVDDENNLTIPTEVTNNRPGCWKIKLIINNPRGCVLSDTAIETVIVEPSPEPDFTFTPPTSLCTPVTIDFINTSNTENINPPSCGNPMYTWSVEPLSGTPATTEGYTLLDAEDQTNISIQFTQAGTYNVSLTLENSCGIETNTQQITVISDPTVSFS